MLMISRHNVYVHHLSVACSHLLISTKHKIQLRLMGMSLVLQVFDHKPKYLTHLNSDLMMVLGEKSDNH